MTEKRFPLQIARDTPTHFTYPEFRTCSWALAELAFKGYAARYGKSQSLERIAERGGFSPAEMIRYLDEALCSEPEGR